jgi:hypothetical protein
LIPFQQLKGVSELLQLLRKTADADLGNEVGPVIIGKEAQKLVALAERDDLVSHAESKVMVRAFRKAMGPDIPDPERFSMTADAEAVFKSFFERNGIPVHAE